MSTRPFDWIMTGLSALAVGGFYLSRWSYQHAQPNGSFSGWQIPVNLALLTILAFLGVNAVLGVRRGRPVRDALPPGYGLSLIGIGVLVLGIVFDPLWRFAFGAEVLLEGLVNPPQLLSLTGGILVLTGPLRGAWNRDSTGEGQGSMAHGPRSTDHWKARGPAVFSIVFALLLLLPFDWMHPAGEAWWMPKPADAAAAVPRNELFVMQADGTRQTRWLFDPAASYYAPSWSPDGRLISYQLSPGPTSGDPGDLYVARAEGTDPKLVSPRSDSASWSPDGRSLVFESDRDELGNPDIYESGIDGSSVRRLTTDHAADFVPVWSPDGRRVAFDSDRSGHTQIYLMDADGSNQHLLIDGLGRSFIGGWAPDGTKVAFASDVDGNFEIYTARADGSGVTRLTNNDVSDYDPKWSPDGRRVLFVSFRDGDAELYLMDATGGEATDVTRDHTLDERAGAAWSPDGSRILFSAHGNPRAELVSSIRADLGIASVLVWSALFAIAALLLVSLGPPFGAVTVVLAIEVTLVAALQANYRFIPSAVGAGLLVDAVLLATRRWLGRRGTAIVAAAVTPMMYFALYFVALAVMGQLDWSAHLWLGSIALAGGIGLFVGWLVTHNQAMPPTEGAAVEARGSGSLGSRVR